MKEISLRQIIERSRNRAERGAKCPRILFYEAGYDDAGSSWLELEFRGGDRIWIKFSPKGTMYPHDHDASGYIPREIVGHATEICSGDDPAAQWIGMHEFSPTTPYRMLNAMERLWSPWVLKALDLEAEA